jgi:hypothetical protein
LDDTNTMVFTGEASDREHVGNLLKILAKLSMKNVKDFEVFLEEKTPEIINNHIIIITSYLSINLCDQIRILESATNTVMVVLLDEAYEAGALTGDIEIYKMTGNHFIDIPGGEGNE